MQIDSKDNIAKLEHAGFCVLKGVFSRSLIDAAREAFWPILTNYLSANRENPNRGPHRHFLAAPFRSPIFSSEFFFDRRVLEIVQTACAVVIIGFMVYIAFFDVQDLFGRAGPKFTPKNSSASDR